MVFQTSTGPNHVLDEVVIMAVAITKGYQFEPARGYLGRGPRKDTYRYMIINDQVEEVREILVHEFTMGDVEDPDLYAAQPLWEWQESEAGKFVMAHAVEPPYWIRQVDHNSYGHRYKIIARLSEPNQTFFKLKFK